MSDDLGSVFAPLRSQAPPVPFAAAETVRRRGRQRARRQLALAAGAVLAVTGTGAGVALAVTDPAGDPVPPAATATADATPPPAVQPGWLLSAEDLGPGQWHTGWETDWDGWPVPPGWPPQRCFDIGFPLPTSVDQEVVTWADGAVRGEAPAAWVEQVVELFAPGTGEAALGELREAVARCADPAEAADTRFTIVDSGFAGDESLLVRQADHDYRGERVAVTHLALVRVGDAVATIRGYAERSGADPAYLRELAQRSADRLGRVG